MKRGEALTSSIEGEINYATDQTPTEIVRLLILSQDPNIGHARTQLSSIIRVQ